MESIEVYLPQLKILFQVFLAMVLGAFIGLEREFADKPAGLRTHMIVASAATLLVGISNSLTIQFSLGLGDQLVRTDPIRVIEAIITGVSFLGAGTIIRRASGSSVEGLTTAASLLFSVAIGICVALSLWVLAVGATFLVLLALRGLHVFEGKIQRSKERQDNRTGDSRG